MKWRIKKTENRITFEAIENGCWIEAAPDPATEQKLLVQHLAEWFWDPEGNLGNDPNEPSVLEAALEQCGLRLVRT